MAAGRRPQLAIAAAAGVCAIAVAPPASTPATRARALPDRDREASVTVRGDTVMAALGAYCLPGDQNERYRTQVCADTNGTPGTKKSLRVAPRDRVVVVTGAKAKRVSVGLERTDRRGHAVELWSRRARRRGGRARQWSVRLPNRLRGAQLLGVSVDYGRRGFADFGASVELCGPGQHGR